MNEEMLHEDGVMYAKPAFPLHEKLSEDDLDEAVRVYSEAASRQVSRVLALEAAVLAILNRHETRKNGTNRTDKESLPVGSNSDSTRSGPREEGGKPHA